MPTILFSLFAIAITFYNSGFAQGQITASAPQTVPQCAITKFSWQGGSAPYYILFNTTESVPESFFSQDDPNAKNVTVIMGERFGNIQDTSYSARIYFKVGSQVSFQVTDSTGQTSGPTIFSVTKGTSGCEVKFNPGDEVVTNDDVGNLTLLIPEQFVQSCDDALTFGWYPAGFPPYEIAVRTVGLPVIQEQLFAGFNSSSPNLQLAFPQNVQVEFEIRDVTGQRDTAGPFTIKPGFGSDCWLSDLTPANATGSAPTTTLPLPTFYPSSAAPSTTSDSGAGPVWITIHHKTKHDGDALSPGTVAGIVIGVPVGLAAVTGLVGIYCAARVRNRRRAMLKQYKALDGK